MIAIIDYEMGNLRSVLKAFEAVGHSAVITRDPKVIDRASRVVLPGVGAFGDCMANLNRFSLVEPICQSIAAGKPFLGICLGLQVLFTESEEFGVHQGLNILGGKVKKIPYSSRQPAPLKIPHMGWNTIRIKISMPLLQGVQSDNHAYFVHSYYVEPSDSTIISTETQYGISFASSVWRDNVFATQFHPEKSQRVGLQILRYFGAWH